MTVYSIPTPWLQNGTSSGTQALTAKVQVSPFVASSGGTAVVAAVVGQAPVPQQTRASRASTRATARAS